jgi:TatD DNase family protein
MIIDFHTHRNRFPKGGMEILSVHPGRHQPGTWYSIGYHPWWNTKKLDQVELEVLKNHLTEMPGCLAIGECGLDKLKGPALSVQLDIFHQHVDLANETGCPVIVHCVRLFHEVIQIKSQKGKTPWVVHGFIRNKTLAQQLVDKGFYLSMAPGGQMTPVFEETLRTVPLDRIFLETDSDLSMTIDERYLAFATLRQIPMEALQEQIFVNLMTFFAWKQKILKNGLSALNS